MQTARHPALTSLIAELETHPVNTNVFFERFSSQRLSDLQLRVFLQQYHYFCKHFVKLLEGLLFRTPLDRLDMRVELTKTLYSELGNGDPHQAHITLLNNFARTLGLDEPALDGTVPIMGVRAYLDRLHHLFLESDYLTALGAEMAVEITAASEFRYLYPGLKAYATFRDEDLRFFRLHLEEEVCHGTWLTDAVQRTAESTRDFDVVASGARRAADAWHRFWVDLYHHVFEPGENGRDAPVTRPPERPNGTGEQS